MKVPKDGFPSRAQRIYSHPEPNGWILIQSPTDGFSSRAQRLDSHPYPNRWILIQSPTDGFSSRAQRMDSHPEPNGWILIQSPTDGHVSQYMLDVLHWLPAEQQISYRIASLVWHCLVGLAPVYLRELCCPPLVAMSSRSLRSSQQGLPLVPFACTSTKQWWAPQPGTASLLNFAFLTEPLHLRFFSP